MEPIGIRLTPLVREKHIITPETRPAKIVFAPHQTGANYSIDMKTGEVTITGSGKLVVEHTYRNGVLTIECYTPKEYMERQLLRLGITFGDNIRNDRDRFESYNIHKEMPPHLRGLLAPS